MDAVDEALELFRSDGEHGKRNRLVLVLGLVSIVAAWLVYAHTLGDVDSAAWNWAEDGPNWTGAAPLLVLLAPGAVLLAVYKRQSVLRYVVGAAAIPLVMLGIGLLNADNRRWQLEARDVFKSYTHRFPKGRLHGVYVPQQTARYITVCANEGPQDPNDAPDDRQFCIDTIVGDNARDKVQGGFRYNADDGAEYGFISHDFFDCFGDTTTCDSAK